MFITLMIMRDVNNGWAVRYTHANVASFFFIFVYAHIARGLYYGSYKAPRVLLWAIGVIILIVMMATAFLGYETSPKWYNKEIKIINNKNKSLFSKKRFYSTSSNVYSNNKNSEKLNTILEELNLEPVYTFENLNLEEVKKEIKNKTKGLSGIYMIVNKITKDYYIGSASTNRFYARFSNHLIYFRGSKIVKLAVNKYKLENFAFIILELYPNIVNKENNRELLDLEDKYLKLLLPNYNILTEAGSSFGYKHTEIDRQKMKDIYNLARREQIGNLNKGKKLSPETIEKMRIKALNRPVRPLDTRDKYIKHTRPLVLYNLDGTVYGKYPTIIKAAEQINCGEKTIRRALNTKKGLVKRQ